MVEIQNIPFWEKDALQGKELGPVAHFGAMVFVIIGFLFISGAASSSPMGPLFPGVTSYALLAGAVGVIALTPGPVLKKLPISLAVFMLLSWMGLSIFWTDSLSGTLFFFKRDMPMYIGFILIAGVLPKDSLIKGLLIAIRIIIIGTFFAVLLFPETRLHIDAEAFEGGTYPGWHGFFSHKNSMAPILVFSFITVLALEKHRVWKNFSLLSIAILLVMSTSGTGLAGVLLAGALFFWLRMFSGLDDRSGSLFFITSIGLGAITILGAIASLAQLTAAYGKDLTFTGRTDIWSVAIKFSAEKPINGWGVGGLLWRESATPRTVATSEFHRLVGFVMPHPHSGVLEVLLQIGFVGLGLYCIVFLGAWYKSWRLVKVGEQLGIWSITILAVQLFMSLSESVFLGKWLVITIIMKSILMRQEVYSKQSANHNFIEIPR